MIKNIFIGFLALIAFCVSDSVGNAASIDMQVITNCSGTQIVRSGVGHFEIQHVAANLPGCINTTAQNTNNTSVILSGSTSTGIIASGTTLIVSTGSVSTASVSTGSVISPATASGMIINCNGNMLTPKLNGGFYMTHTTVNLPGCINTSVEPVLTTSGSIIKMTARLIDLSNGPLFDIRSTQIANYRKKLLQNQNIQFANPVRSVRIRAAATKKSQTKAILMKNDAVINSGNRIGWDRVQGADLVITDSQENTVTADTSGKVTGYTAAKYLRDPNVSDLVRIGQADFAYWSDIVHVKVSHLVNVRSHPWYTAPIVTTLGNMTSLYVISTVDNWSEVRNESGTIRGYIRSDFLIVDKAQREDNWLSIR